MMGAQKCTVFGPTWEFQNLLNPDSFSAVLVASAAVVCVLLWANRKFVLICWRKRGWRKDVCAARKPNLADMLATSAIESSVVA